MVSIIFRELFEIGFPHRFYTNGKCPDLEVVPTAACQQVLRALGLRFLPTETGGKLLARADKSGPVAVPVYTIKNPVPENSRFTFLIRVKNPVFETFSLTKLDRTPDQVYYFNNLAENLSGDGFPLLVSNKLQQRVTDSDLLTVRRGTFAFTDSSPAPQQTGELQMMDNEEVQKLVLANNRNVFHFSFEMAKMTYGRTRFSIEGTERETFYNLPAGEGAIPFGIIDVFHRTVLPAGCRFQQADNTITTRFYQIPFENRATRWRYVITKKFNAGVSGVDVLKSNGGAMHFVMQGSASEGKFVMASVATVPMQEQPISGVQLRDQDNHILISHLPNPSFGFLKKEGSDLFSDVFITI